ncbi:MAG: ATP-binding protein, partial [Planctomycetes bacterium]|nr:ATP-binding protein [Planctomycetota bacterium]
PDWRGLVSSAVTDTTTKRVRALECHVSGVSGSPFDAEITAIPFEQEQEQKAYLIFTDISSRIEEARKLAAARDAAEAVADAKTRFLATMSHEIRTPLNGILGSLQLISKSRVDLQTRDYLDIIEASGNHLLRIINDILDYSRLEAGMMPLEKRPIQLRPTIEEVIHGLQGAAHASGVRLRSSYAEDLPRYILGDAGKISQVLLNLIGNAIKFAQKGMVSVRTSTQQRDGTPWLMVDVEDDGIGIPADKIAKLFEPFEQADSSHARQYGGTGLGLAISSQISVALEGTLECTSKLGVGSTFTFAFPYSIAEAAEESDLSSDSSDTREHEPIRPLHVLVAEDNRVNATVISAMLRKLGHSFALVEDGGAVLNELQEGHFDAILMDC